MCFRETDHWLKLASCGRYAAFSGADVGSKGTHGDICVDKGSGGGGGEGWVAVVASIGDVGRQEFDWLETCKVSMCSMA